MVKFKLFLIACMCFYSSFLYAFSCQGDFEYFNRKFKVIPISDSAIKVEEINTSKDTTITLAIGEDFNGIQDRHGHIFYTLINISKENVLFKFSSSFDTRGLGGNLSECGGNFTVKFKNV